jgi:uncharacterized membrane protein YphA (DoxX/SURF4 family)
VELQSTGDRKMREFQDVIAGSDTSFISAARVLLGLFVLGLGVVTFFVPELKVAFMNQLDAGHIPLQGLTMVVLPTLEGIVGVMLIGGYLVRLASFVSVLIMALLTYLHLVVAEPMLLPLQFGLPLIPIVALVLSGFLYFVESYTDEI